MTRQAMQPHGVVGQVFGALMEALNAPVYRAVTDHVRPGPGEAWLDVGCGTGAMLARLGRAMGHGTLVGVDPSAVMVARARRRLRRLPGLDVDVRRGTADATGLAADAFDGAVALHCFQFWPDPARGLGELARVLRPGGRLVLALRDHGARPPHWLPNPLSRGPDEARALAELLREEGWTDVRAPGRAAGSPLVEAISARR